MNTKTCSKSSPSGNSENLEITSPDPNKKVVWDLSARAGIISRTFLWILKQIPCTLAVIPQSQKIQRIERIMKVEEVGSKAFVFDLAVVGGWWLVEVVGGRCRSHSLNNYEGVEEIYKYICTYDYIHIYISYLDIYSGIYIILYRTI